MRPVPTSLPEVVAFSPVLHEDARGVLFEAWRAGDGGLPRDFAQDNVSRSRPGVLRGLHFQHPHGQGKLVTLLAGAIHDVAVDVRRDSPRFGRWVGVRLCAEGPRQLWVPPGFAHGFLVLGDDDAIVHYKLTSPYRPDCERGIPWDDPAVGVAWPAGTPLLSPRDASWASLASLPAASLPVVGDSA